MAQQRGVGTDQWLGLDVCTLIEGQDDSKPDGVQLEPFPLACISCRSCFQASSLSHHLASIFNPSCAAVAPSCHLRVERLEEMDLSEPQHGITAH